MTCEKCGKHKHQETLKHEGHTIRVCQKCGNAIRAERNPKRAARKELRRIVAREKREAQAKEGVSEDK